jgi:hypothetical protein
VGGFAGFRMLRLCSGIRLDLWDFALVPPNLGGTRGLVGGRGIHIGSQFIDYYGLHLQVLNSYPQRYPHKKGIEYITEGSRSRVDPIFVLRMFLRTRRPCGTQSSSYGPGPLTSLH